MKITAHKHPDSNLIKIYFDFYIDGNSFSIYINKFKKESSDIIFSKMNPVFSGLGLKEFNLILFYINYIIIFLEKIDFDEFTKNTLCQEVFWKTDAVEFDEFDLEDKKVPF